MASFLIFIIILSILIIAHEYGHFLAARRSGVKVEKFSIGFGPPLLKVDGKETQFLICLFPLGGYVKLAGDSRSEHTGRECEFLSKPAGIKARIVFFGPLFNYILSFLIFWIIAVVGLPYLEAVIGEVLEGYPAKHSNLLKGDRIIEVNGNKVYTWDEMSEAIRKSKGKVSLKLEREGKILFLEVPLKEKEVRDVYGKKRNISVIGIAASSEVKIVKYNVFTAFVKGAQILYGFTTAVIKGMVFMAVGILPAREAVAGPLGIYYITSQAVKIGITALMHLTAVLSLSLSIVNLIPLPLLDGGHLIIFLVEKIRRRPLSEKSEEFLTRVGFVILGLLVIFVFYNDIVKYGSHLWKK